MNPGAGHNRRAAAAAAFAETLADAAREVCLKYFRAPFDIERKPDASPVTIADREAEQAMRAVIEKTFPEDGIMGEEFGSVREGAERLWVLDPIDGTASFVTGKPVFGCLIAYLESGVPVAGVIEMPALGERWTGAAGGETVFTRRRAGGGDGAGGGGQSGPARTRACPDLSAAWLASTAPGLFKGEAAAAFARLQGAASRTIWGGDCHNYGLAAGGWLDIVCEWGMQPYDYLALAPVVEGAGGRCTDWRGAALDLHSKGDVLACGDARVHAAALELLNA